jgi:hypothetical protein
MGGGLRADDLRGMDREEIERLAQARGIDSIDLALLVGDLRARTGDDGPGGEVLISPWRPSTGSPGLDFVAAGLLALAGMGLPRWLRRSRD